MKMMKKYALLIMLVCSINTVSAQKNTAADEQSIRDARTASNAAIAKQDIAGVAKYWMNDFVEISSDGSLISGRQAVISDWEKMYKAEPKITFERQLQEISFNKKGDLALEKGILKYPSYNYEGFYTALWRKADGIWVTQMENFVSLK
jgi:ketosteroid isomerase-like protein